MILLKGCNLPETPALAFLGDSVHSLYIRKKLVMEGKCKSGVLHKEALSFVTAEKQSEVFIRIQEILTVEEKDLVRRAYNSHHVQKPKHATMQEYRQATAFEALLGAHEYLGNKERIQEILSYAYQNEENSNGDKENDSEN